MTQYLLTIIQPDGPPPAAEVLARIGQDLHTLNEQIKAAGSWVFTGGLHAPGTATVVRERDGEVVMTDGPFLEAKEHVGGLWIVDAPDLDVALEWAATASRATGLPIEVRPFRDGGDY